MGKKQRETPVEETAKGLAAAINSPPELTLSAPWGYGFEKHGGKWRAYRTEGGLTTYLTPLPGRELHHVISQIQQALSQEVATATKARRSGPVEVAT